MTDLDHLYRQLVSFCAYRERCSYEVAQKARRLNMDPLHIEDLMARLIEDKYLDDQRYADSFVYSKLTYHGWGPLKIRQALLSKQLSSHQIEQAIRQIHQATWLEQLDTVLRQRHQRLLTDEGAYPKLVRLGQQKGYPIDWVIRCVDPLFSNEG